MTPAKEKALELVSQMYIYQWRKDTVEYRNAVNCAIVAVDEILEIIRYHGTDIGKHTLMFWNEVKIELKTRL